jgi:phage terminase large subunit-like protein
MTAKITYTTMHEGNTATRKTARAYEFAVWGCHSPEQVAKHGYTNTNATEWGVIGWCGNRKLADATFKKWARVFDRIAIAPAAPVASEVR